MKIESEIHYLRDASVAKVMENGAPLRGCLTIPDIAFVPVGEWLVATRDFHLPGGSGQDWESPGADVKAGQKFRLVRAGQTEEPAIWEIA